MKPVSVGVRDAKVQLSRLLKWVQRGREVILTDRGRPVGKLIPVDTQTLPLAERIRRLEKKGVIERRAHAGGRKIPAPIPIPEGVAQGFLQEDRRWPFRPGCHPTSFKITVLHVKMGTILVTLCSGLCVQRDVS